MAKAPTAAMSEQEAANLSMEVEKNLRFRVAGRRTIPGKGVHLIVVDQNTEYKHIVHSREHWRRLTGDIVLLAEGPWEEITLDFLARLEQAERETTGRGVADVQRRRVLKAHRQVLLSALTMTQRFVERVASSAQSHHLPVGRGWVGPVKARPGLFKGTIRIDGRTHNVHGRSPEECRSKLDAIAAGREVDRGTGPRLTYRWGHGRIRPMTSHPGLFRGVVQIKGKRWAVYSRDYDECCEKFAALKQRLAAELGIPLEDAA